MSDYIASLLPALAKNVDLTAVLPEGKQAPSDICALPFRWDNSGKAGPLSQLKPWRHRQYVHAVLQNKPQVIHILTGEGVPFNIFLSLAARRRGIPTVVTVHDPEAHPGMPLENLNHRLGGTTLRLASRIHIHSERLRRHLPRNVQSKAQVIPHLSVANQYTKYAVPNQPKNILFFGRLAPYKGLDTLLGALEIVSRSRPVPEVLICGPGNLPADFVRKAEKLPFLHIVNHYLSHKEVAEVFAQALLFVMPYRQATQSSIPLLCSAFEVPLIATNVGFLPEIGPEIGAVLVPPADPQALAKAISEFLDHPHLSKKTDRYEPSAIAGKFTELYRSVVEEAR